MWEISFGEWAERRTGRRLRGRLDTAARRSAATWRRSRGRGADGGVGCGGLRPAPAREGAGAERGRGAAAADEAVVVDRLEDVLDLDHRPVGGPAVVDGHEVVALEDDIGLYVSLMSPPPVFVRSSRVQGQLWSAI